MSFSWKTQVAWVGGGFRVAVAVAALLVATSAHDARAADCGYRVVWSEGGDLQRINLLDIRFLGSDGGKVHRTYCSVPDIRSVAGHDWDGNDLTVSLALSDATYCSDALTGVSRSELQALLRQWIRARGAGHRVPGAYQRWASVSWYGLSDIQSSDEYMLFRMGTRGSPEPVGAHERRFVSHFFDALRPPQSMCAPEPSAEARQDLLDSLLKVYRPMCCPTVDPETRSMALRACWALGDRVEVSSYLCSDSSAVRESAVYMLATEGPSESIAERLVRILYSDPSERVRWAAVRCLGQYDSQPTLDMLESGLPLTLEVSFSTVALRLAVAGRRKGLRWHTWVARERGTGAPRWVLVYVPEFLSVVLPRGAWKEEHEAKTRETLVRALCKADNAEWSPRLRMWVSPK